QESRLFFGRVRHYRQSRPRLSYLSRLGILPAFSTACPGGSDPGRAGWGWGVLSGGYTAPPQGRDEMDSGRAPSPFWGTTCFPGAPRMPSTSPLALAAGSRPARAAVNAGFHLYARRRARELAALDPVEEQRRTLLGLVRRAAGTAFGKDHGFSTIRS